MAKTLFWTITTALITISQLGNTAPSPSETQQLRKGSHIERAASCAVPPGSQPTPSANPYGPLFPQAFADPSIIRVNGTFWGFATNGNGKNVPVAHSNELKNGWIYDSDLDALPTGAGAWAVESDPKVWGPHVTRLDNSGFVMYYAAAPKDNISKVSHCTGVAFSEQVQGPYVPRDVPLFCDKERGFIDPYGFHYQGERYVVYKNLSHVDESCKTPQACEAQGISNNSTIWIQQLQGDGYSLKGRGHQLIKATPGEYDIEGAAIVENPSRPGTFVLFFNIHDFKDDNYNIKYATSSNLLGCEDGAAGQGCYQRQGIVLGTGCYNGVNLTSPGGIGALAHDPTSIIFMSDRADHFGTRNGYTGTLQYDGDEVKLAPN